MSYIGNQVTSVPYIVDVYNGDGSTVAFGTLARSPAGTASIAVYVNGVYQRPGFDYSLNGAVITFTVAPGVGTNNVIIHHLGNGTTTQVPSDGSVTGVKLASGAVSGNNITANAIRGNNIVAGQITGNLIAGNSISGNNIVAGQISGNHFSSSANTVIRTVPPVGTQTSSYVLTTADIGKYVQVSSGGSIEIPDAIFSEGDVVCLFNNTGSSATITCNITTAYIAGTDSDKATMTLATRGLATIFFISNTICVVAGNIT